MSIKNNYTIGVDVGGTKIAAVLFDGERTIADYSLATPKDNFDHFLIMMTAVVEPLLEKARELKVKVSGIGIGIPGVFSPDNKKIIKCPNVKILDGMPLLQKMEKIFNMPVNMDNDTNCFTRAEAVLGAGKDYNNVYGLIIGTGIGGGWWFNDKIYSGFRGAANEPGRMIINFNEPIELEAMYHNLMSRDPKRQAQEAYRGNIIAEKAFYNLGVNIGLALANIVNLIDPGIIIIGGGAIESDDLFLPTIRKVARENIMSAEGKKIKIVKSKLGELAGAMGAGMLFARNA